MQQKSAIMQMFYGEMCRGHIKHTAEFWKLRNTLMEKENELRKKLKELSPEILDLMDTIEEETGLLNAESEDNYFAAGFQFGLRMGLEISGKVFENEL